MRCMDTISLFSFLLHNHRVGYAISYSISFPLFYRHFTIRGAEGTDFEGGVYHGRILLPPEYPFKPPHIVFLTPSGRFETGTKVCLSFSAYHPELWQPAWGIRLILEALISFLPTPADGAIGALDWTPQERKRELKMWKLCTLTFQPLYILTLISSCIHRVGAKECRLLLSSMWKGGCSAPGTKGRRRS